MFSHDRNELRSVYLEAWRKAKAGEPLEPAEQQIAEVAGRHPEYHALLESGEDALTRDWLPEDGESNPFLHMALHIVLLEQVQTDRPPGIRACYRRMIETCLGDVHEAEHRIMDCIAEQIWRTQRYQREFSPKAYLKCVKRNGAGARHRD
ncbi:MAG: DUF1841 family protein [Thiohalocapsa sp.]|jgi:hypothetical protein